MDQSGSFSHGHMIGWQEGHLLSGNCGMLADSALQISAYRRRERERDGVREAQRRRGEDDKDIEIERMTE